MLELRPNCECCDCNLPPSSADAMICSFECTFCRACADTKLGGIRPNCGGNLVARPIRPESKSDKNPPSSVRIIKPQGCGADREEEYHRKILEGLADVDAGRVVEHKVVQAWAENLGTGKKTSR